MSISLPRPWPNRLVAVAIGMFVLFFGLTVWLRQVNLGTSQFDMGNMDQVLWHSVHGQWFAMTSPGSAQLISRSSIHADFLLLIYSPFYYLLSDPRTMLILQVILVASGAIPLFWIGRQRLGSKHGALFAILYLFYPALEWAVTFDVHAVVLAMPLLLWAWWAATKRRWWIYAVAVALVLLAKEEVGLVVAAMGLYWVWRRGYRIMGLASLAVGLSWSMVMAGWLIPHFRRMPGHFALSYYADFGGTYTAIIKNLLAHPIAVMRDVFDGHSLSLLRALLFPVSLVPLIGWPVLLVAFPDLAINLLSRNHNQQTIFYQYMSVTTPFIWLATIDGWVRARRWLQRRWPRNAAIIERWGTVGFIIMAGISIWVWSPLPGTRHNQDAIRFFRPSPYRADVRFVQHSLKPSDRVVATNNLVPQFSRRDLIWGFPYELDRADAIVVLEGGKFEFVTPAEISQTIKRIAQDSNWTVVRHDGGFWYLRRVDTKV